MQKMRIFEVLKCNRILSKLMEQNASFSISTGFKIFQTIKKFDEVEEYVFDAMTKAFGAFDVESMTEEQKIFYQYIILSEVEVDIKKLPIKAFENCEETKLSMDDIKILSIILCEDC